MGKLGRDILRRKLERHLASSLDEPMLAMISAVVAIQGGNPAPLHFFVDLPPEAVGAELGSPYHVPPWILETLVNELLAAKKAKGFGVGRTRVLRHDNFAVIRQLARTIIDLENAEDGIYLASHDIFWEMARIAQRQFPWQRGAANAPNLYRSLLLYGSGKAGEFFEASSGLSISDFVKIGAYLSGALAKTDWRDRFQDLSMIGITPQQREAALARYALRHVDARGRATETRRARHHTAYRPSILRDFPVIAFGERAERLRAPLPELIMYRYTSGLYLDVVKGGAQVWTEIGQRFELYCLDYLSAMLAPLAVSGESVYGPKKARNRTPDILVRSEGKVIAVIECKAKRMSYEARFSDAPVVAAATGFDEIAKGIFQLWRFFSHGRRGLVPGMEIADDCLAIMITADSWLTMARNQEAEVIAAAHALADKAGDISIEDRREVAFCLIDDVEFALQHGTGESFLSACREIASGEKKGWILSVAHLSRQDLDRPYPFLDRISQLLPWMEASTDSRLEMAKPQV